MNPKYSCLIQNTVSVSEWILIYLLSFKDDFDSMKRKPTFKVSLSGLLFILYILVLIYFLFLRRVIYPDSFNNALLGSVNIVPFQTILLFLNVILHRNQGLYSKSLIQSSYWNLLGNIGAFVPLGIFLPKLYKKFRRFWRTVIFAACLIFGVEILQYITRLGSCDIDDFFLNILGVILGFILYRTFF